MIKHADTRLPHLRLSTDRERCRYCNPRRLPRAVKLGREGLVAQQPAQSWDSVSSAGIPVLRCSSSDACSELWVIVEYCDRGTLGVRLASLGCAACEREAGRVLRAGPCRMDSSPRLHMLLSALASPL